LSPFGKGGIKIPLNPPLKKGELKGDLEGGGGF